MREREGERDRGWETERGRRKQNEGKVSTRHVPRFFNIESKAFRIKVDDLSFGGSILITEKVRERLFHVSIELSCVEWLIKELQGLLVNKVQSFFRRYRGDSYQVWVEKLNNWKGYYLRLTKCVHGIVKSVVIPRGRHDSGWIQVRENLEGILTGRNRPSRHRGPESVVKTDLRVSGTVSGKTYKEAVQTEEAAQEKEKGTGTSDDTSNWSWVVVCERQVLHQSWDDIRKALEGWLEKDVKLFPYQINRAFFTCDSKLEAMTVTSSGKLALEGQTDVLLYSWEHGLKNNAPKIVSYGGWLGITGLPMHWWTKNFFQRIGMECGGFLEVDQRTENYKYLFEAKIKTRRNLSGFLPEIVTLTEGTETYYVKIRPISPAIRPTISWQAPPTVSDSRVVPAAAEGEVPTCQSHQRTDDFPQVNWDQGIINEGGGLKTDSRNLMGGTVQIFNARGNGISTPAAENSIHPCCSLNLHDKGRKETEEILGPTKDKPISNFTAQFNPFSGFPPEPNPFLKTRSFSEPGPIGGIQKNKISDSKPNSEGTADKLKSKTRFLSKFGRANGEGNRGFRVGLSHIYDRLSSADEPMQISSLPSKPIADREDDDSVSSICPESVDSVVKIPSSDSEFIDEISSNEEKKNTDAFDNEEGILHELFDNPDIINGANGYVGDGFPVNTQSDDQRGEEDYEDETIVPETIPEVLYYSRKRGKRRGKGCKDTLPKSLLHKMDISLMPLKKNLAHRRHGKLCASNGDSGSRGTGKGKEKTRDLLLINEDN
ncbi:hypothetical protein CerSpe_010270 [Prunus speciosa]